jgi:hypothetical protein
VRRWGLEGRGRGYTRWGSAGEGAHVASPLKLTLTLDMPRVLAERLSARAIREGKNLEVVVIAILDASRLTGRPRLPSCCLNSMGLERLS